MLDGYRLLIVEDHRDSAALLCLYLAAKGIQCAVCPTSLAALDEISDEPMAIILDVGLPGISGLDLAKAIRERPNGERHILIGYSGYGREDDRQRALEAGMDAYFVKPSPIDDLLAAISMVAAKRAGLPKGD